MASQKVFFTGATGYIGGDAFVALHEKHPDWDYTCLVRSSDKGAQLVKDYPKVHLVYGDLDSADLLKTEAGKADIVVHLASADHEAGAVSIVEGIKASSSPAYLVHLSGTGVLIYPDLEAKTFGELRTKVWDDIKDIDDLVSGIPETAPHRKVELAIINSGLKSVIVSPPTIWGPGRGVNPRSIQVPTLAQAMLKEKRGFFVGDGKNMWTHVNVADLSSLFVLLIEDAAAGGQKASWGPQGYYFSDNGAFVWGDVCRAVAKEIYAKGFFDSPDCVGIPGDEVEKMQQAGSFLWGTNSRATSSRAHKELGWSPKHADFLGSLAAAVDHELDMHKRGVEPAFRV